MTQPETGSWITGPDGAPTWRQPDGSLWRLAPDGVWVAAPNAGDAPPPAPRPPQGTFMSAVSRLGVPGWLAIGGALLGGLGVLLPWASVLFISVAGTDVTDGKVYGGVVLAALVFVVLRQVTAPKIFDILSLLAGLAMTGIAVYVLVDIESNGTGPFGIKVNPGSGLYLSLIGAVLLSTGVALQLRRGGSAVARPLHLSRRAWVVAGAVVLVLAGAISTAVVLTRPTPDHPERVVSKYLNALAAGDADTALSFGPAPGDRTFLTSDILKKQQALAPISDVKISKIDAYGENGDVHASYLFGGENVDTTLSIVKHSGKWQLENTFVTVDVSSAPATTRIALFGSPLPNAAKITVFPGPLQFSSLDPNLELKGEVSTRFATSPDDMAPYLDFELDLSDHGRQAATAAVSTALATCEKADSLEPARCPQSTFALGDAVPGSVHWKRTGNIEDLNLQPAYDDPHHVDVSGQLKWSVTYKYTDYDGSVASGSDDVTSSVSCTVDLNATTPTCTFN